MRACPAARSNADAERRARIECGAHGAGKVLLAHRGRIAQRAVATDEFCAVAANGPRGVVDVEEGDAPGELGVVRIAREQRAGVRVDLGGHVHCGFGAQIAEHPFDVAGDREPACAARTIAQASAPRT